MAGSLSVYTSSSSRVRFSHLSARSIAACMRAVPTPFPANHLVPPCQSARHDDDGAEWETSAGSIDQLFRTQHKQLNRLSPPAAPPSVYPTVQLRKTVTATCPILLWGLKRFAARLHSHLVLCVE